MNSFVHIVKKIENIFMPVTFGSIRKTNPHWLHSKNLTFRKIRLKLFLVFSKASKLNISVCIYTHWQQWLMAYAYHPNYSGG
jgi:hypothetical protein